MQTAITEACASFRRRSFLDSRFRGNDVIPALRLRSGQAPAGIQCSLSLGNPLRPLLRQQANYAQSSNKLTALIFRRALGDQGLVASLLGVTLSEHLPCVCKRSLFLTCCRFLNQRCGFTCVGLGLEAK